MSRRFSVAVTAYFPLVLTILFGLVLSLLPISSALGSNVGACQGTTTTSKISFGGRVMTPTLILRASTTNQPCGANESSLSLVSLSRTLIVSPNGTSTQNGTALLSAMTTISNSNPTASNPYLLKLEPGNYDLGSSSLTLLPYVDLEGSGEDTTVISSTVGGSYSKATLVMASNSEVRFVRVANSGANSLQVAVFIPGSATNTRLLHLTATATASGSALNHGIASLGGTFTVQDSTITASGGASSRGMMINQGTATVLNSTFTASGATSYNYGILINQGTMTVLNSTFTASGANNSDNYVIFNNAGTLTVQNTTMTASGSSKVYGLNNTGSSTATVLNSTFTASGGTTSYGIYVDTDSTATVQNSTLTASSGTTSYGLFVNSPGIAKVGASQLAGGTAASQNLTLCPASYNGNTFVLLNASCQ